MKNEEYAKIVEAYKAELERRHQDSSWYGGILEEVLEEMSGGTKKTENILSQLVDRELLRRLSPTEEGRSLSGMLYHTLRNFSDGDITNQTMMDAYNSQKSVRNFGPASKRLVKAYLEEKGLFANEPH